MVSPIYRVFNLVLVSWICLVTSWPFLMIKGRGIETNLYAQFKCDSLKIGMVLTSFVLSRYFVCSCLFFLFLMSHPFCVNAGEAY